MTSTIQTYGNLIFAQQQRDNLIRLTSWLKKYKKQTIIFDQFSCSSVISECQSWQKFKYYVKKIKNVCIFANSNTDNQLKMFKNY